MTAGAVTTLPDLVRAACASVHDPEFGLSIDDLGLIYDVQCPAGAASVAMTLTTPTCPAGGVIVDAVRAAVAAVPGVRTVDVQLVWEPEWTPHLISAQGRAFLGWHEAEP
jgi:metal-sulfur cluster biosynthetic enzyme